MCMLAMMSSFPSGMAYPFLNFLPPLSPVDPYSDCVGVNTSLRISLSFLNVYVTPIRCSSTDGRANSFSSSIFPLPEITLFWETLTVITLSGTPKVLFYLFGRKEGAISSDLFPLNDLDIPPTFLHRSCGSSSSDISFVPSAVVLSCSWEVL